VDQYNPLLGFVNSVALPGSGPNSFVLTGNGTTEGALSRSPDGSLLTLAGYNAPAGGPGIPFSSNSIAVPRVVGALDSSGSFSTPAATMGLYTNGNTIRSAVTDNANNYWAVGSTGGLNYFGNTAAAGNVAPNPATGRVLNVVNGNLTWSATAPGMTGIFQVNGFPTGAAVTNWLLFTTGTGTGTPLTADFAFNSAMTLAYVADERAPVNGGGVQRWDWTGTSWALSYTLNIGGGARGLAVDFDGSGTNAVIYATTADASNNRLVSIIDTGAGSMTNATVFAGANRAFRGLEFAPIPEPSSFGLLVVAGAGVWLRFRRKLHK
jgi:hypothetical protein